MIIFCNCHLNLNHFQIVLKQHLRKILWVFKFKYYFFVMKQDIISYMSTVEDTKSMFITHIYIFYANYKKMFL